MARSLHGNGLGLQNPPRHRVKVVGITPIPVVFDSEQSLVCPVRNREIEGAVKSDTKSDPLELYRSTCIDLIRVSLGWRQAYFLPAKGRDIRDHELDRSRRQFGRHADTFARGLVEEPRRFTVSQKTVDVFRST